MRITVLTPYLPYEGVPHAGGAFLHAYLRHVRATAEVRVLAPALDENVEAVARARLDGLDIHLVELDDAPPLLPRRMVNRARTLAGGLMLEAALERDFRARAPWALAAASDIVEIQWSHFLPFVGDVRRAAPRVPVSVMLHDVATQVLRRRAVEASLSRERRYARVMVRRAARREPRLLNRSDVAWVFSDADRRLLRALGVHIPVGVVDPPLELPDPPVGAALAPCALFTGYLRRAPNHEAATWLLDRVWPLVLAAQPDARLVIAGAEPPPDLVSRSGPSVTITGYVDDLEPFYRSARVFVAPLRSGAGLKFKVPQAMIYGLPVVATSVAAEGVADRSGPGVFAAVTDEPREMAAAVAGLLADPARAREIGVRARAWALDAYAFGASVERVLASYRELMDAEIGRASPSVASLSAGRSPSPP